MRLCACAYLGVGDVVHDVVAQREVPLRHADVLLGKRHRPVGGIEEEQASLEIHTQELGNLEGVAGKGGWMGGEEWEGQKGD